MTKINLSDVVDTSLKTPVKCVKIWHPEDQPYDFPFDDFPDQKRTCLWVIEAPKDFGGFPGTEYLFYSGLDGDTDKIEMEDSIIYFVYERKSAGSVGDDIDLRQISNHCDDDHDFTCGCSVCH